ncbi:MAG TPA: ABC transporter substrate-binding protein [Acidimicrobiales bacterium]|nr:ABC transporter substrate-binding protein [Acidimicrobiales bacterium]
MHRRPKGFRAPASTALLVVALAAVACSSGGSASAAKPPPGVLRLGVEAPGSLDPAQARSPSELLLAEQLFDGLTAYDAKTLAVKPALASAWEATPDFTQWDFTLRPDARFGNGRQITSADVKYTFERIARRGSSSPGVTQLELVAGFKPYNVTGKAGDLAGLSTPSPEVVRFNLDAPHAVLPAVLGNPVFGIVPRESVESVPPSPAFARQPMGSGPFVIQSRTDSELRLVPAPEAKTEVKGINVFLARDVASAYADFLRGGVDWAEAPTNQFEPVPRGLGEDGFRPYIGQLFYAFNLKNPKFADQRFRQAIVHAIDRDAIVRVVYGRSVLTATGLVAEGVPGSQPNACAEVCRFDPDRARALLEEAFGERPPPEFAIDFDDNPTQAAVAEAMQANLKAVGINAGLRPHAYGDYLKFALSGQQEMFRLGWIGAYPHPDAFLTPLFTSGTTDNVSGFSSGEVDGLLRQARAEPDEGKRMAAYQEAEKLVLAQVPVLPVAQFQTHAVTAPRVENLALSVFGTFDASQVRLDD